MIAPIIALVAGALIYAASASLFPSLCAAAAIGGWIHARRRAKAAAAQLHSCRAAIQSMRYEAANAANAIRINLLDFRQENPAARAPEHLDEIEFGTRRVAAAVNKYSG